DLDLDGCRAEASLNARGPRPPAVVADHLVIEPARPALVLDDGDARQPSGFESAELVAGAVQASPQDRGHDSATAPRPARDAGPWAAARSSRTRGRGTAPRRA